MTEPVHPELRGQYAPRTDHLSFNHRIPDAFPGIDFSVSNEALAPPMASLVDEFVHRAQWTLTATGMVYRVGCHVQVLHTLEVLRVLADDPLMRVPAPWLTGDLPADPALHQHIAVIRAIDVTQRYLLGQPLSSALLNNLPRALALTRTALSEAAPLTFGTFDTWDFDRLYHSDGRPIRRASTQNILESHASTFAVELLRGCSHERATGWLNAYVADYHRGVYLTLQELAAEARHDVDTRALLRLADWALSCPLTFVHGVPPPPDYLEAAVPYARYAESFQRFPSLIRTFADLGEENPSALLLVEAVIASIGDIRPGIVNMPPDRSRDIAVELDSVDRWEADRMARLDGAGALASFSKLVTGAIVETVQRYLLGLFETHRDAMSFEPTPERFARMCALSDFPVISYPDGLEVFLCRPTEDPQWQLKFRTTIFGLTVATRALHAPTAPQPLHLPFDLAAVLEWCGVGPGSSHVTSLGAGRVHWVICYINRLARRVVRAIQRSRLAAARRADSRAGRRQASGRNEPEERAPRTPLTH